MSIKTNAANREIVNILQAVRGIAANSRHDVIWQHVDNAICRMLSLSVQPVEGNGFTQNLTQDAANEINAKLYAAESVAILANTDKSLAIVAKLRHQVENEINTFY